MRKKNGFTLVELLAVVSILALICVITIPIVMNLFTNNQKITDAVNQSIVKASGIYVSEYPDEVDWYIHKNNYKDVCIDLSALVDKGYFKDQNVNVDKLEKDYSVRVTADTEDSYSYAVIKSSSCVFDDTVPRGYIGNISWTTKSVSVDLVCTEDDSKVKAIEYYDLNEDKWKKVNVDLNAVVSKKFVFNNLKNDKSYQISFKCLNTADMIGDEISQTIDLAQLSSPVITLDTSKWSKEKYATIKYDTTNNDYEFYYQLDGNGWLKIDDSDEFEKVSDGTYRYHFTSGGHTMIAKNFDGVNDSTYASLAVNKIDTTSPTCNVIKNESTVNGINLSVVASDEGGSGFGTSNVSTKTENYLGVKANSSYTISDEAGNTNSCEVEIASKIQERKCNTCSTCSSTTCSEYNSCSDSSCGCNTWNYEKCNCQQCEDGCKSYNYTEKCTSYTYDTASGRGCSGSGTCTDSQSGPYQRTCKCCTSVRGSCKTYYYKECNCSECKTTCSSYKSCPDSSCGCKTYEQKTSCSSCGCDAWSDWTDVTTCSSSASVSCQTLYY